MLRFVAALVAVSASACGGGGYAFLSSEGMGALLLVVEQGDLIELEAIDLASSTVVRREPPGGATVYALGYAESLDRLGLRPGSLELTAQGGAVPPADQQYVLEGTTWSPIALLPPDLTALRIATPEGCATFEQRARSVPLTEDRPRFAVTLDEHRVFVGTDAGRFEMHELDRSYDVTTLSTATPHLAGFAHGDEVWLIGPGTSVAHGHPDRGFVDAPPLPFNAAQGVRIDGARGDAPLELFVMSTLQGVAHFDGQAWRLIRAEVGETPHKTQPGVTWIEPGLAVIVGVSHETVIEISSAGIERRIDLMLPGRVSPDTVWTTAYIEGRGPVIGTRANTIFTRRDAAWRLLPISEVSPRADALVSLGRGAFIAGGQGRFAQWRGTDELCETLSVPSGIETRASARLGSGFVLIVDGFEARSVIIGSRNN